MPEDLELSGVVFLLILVRNCMEKGGRRTCLQLSGVIFLLIFDKDLFGKGGRRTWSSGKHYAFEGPMEIKKENT